MPDIDWSATRWRVERRRYWYPFLGTAVWHWCALAPPESESPSLTFNTFDDAITYATQRAYYARVKILSLEAQFVTDEGWPQ